MNNSSERDWSETKEQLKDKYPILTDKDFKDEDNEDKLLNHLAQKTGESEEQLRDIMRDS